jgi:hypothetical protein
MDISITDTARDVWVQMGRERVTWDEFCVGLLGSHDDLQFESDSQVTSIPHILG